MPEDTGSSAEEAELARRLGDHLRRLRKQKGLSLLDVQALSEGEFKASVLGAYERGERAVSAARLARLAGLYRLPLQAMLPPSPDSMESGTGVAVDLARLDQSKAPEARAVARFVRRIQAQRQDWAAGVFRMRSDDVLALASAVDRTPEDLLKFLEEKGLRAY